MEKINTYICSLKDDKACAVTFTTDDALYRSCLFYLSKFKEYGLKGTAAFTTDFVADGGNSNFSVENGFGTWEHWQEFFSEGCFDIANHSKSHPYLDKLAAETLDLEINQTRQTLQNYFPGYKILSMANPFVVTNNTVDEYIRQLHFSARNGQNGFNSLSPSEDEWYHLNFQTALHNTTAEAMNEWIDKALITQSWLIEMWHGVDGQGWEAPPSEVCGRHLEYLSLKLDTVWNGTMDEVTQYLREKQHAMVKTLLQDQSHIAVTLTTDLDAALFNYPLTLKTTIPTGWTHVRIRCGQQEVLPDIQEKDGLQYVLYDVIPNTGLIILENRAL